MAIIQFKIYLISSHEPQCQRSYAHSIPTYQIFAPPSVLPVYPNYTMCPLPTTYHCWSKYKMVQPLSRVAWTVVGWSRRIDQETLTHKRERRKRGLFNFRSCTSVSTLLCYHISAPVPICTLTIPCIRCQQHTILKVNIRWVNHLKEIVFLLLPESLMELLAKHLNANRVTGMQSRLDPNPLLEATIKMHNAHSIWTCLDTILANTSH